MRKTIIVGSLVCVCVLVMLPSVPAVNYTAIVNENKAQVLKEFRGMSRDELKEKIKSIDWSQIKQSVALKENTRIYLIYSILLFLTGTLTVLLASISNFGLFFGPIIGMGSILYYLLQVLGIITPEKI